MTDPPGMSAEIISFARWQRRPAPCGCRHCLMVEITWHRFGAKQPLADFIAEHSPYPRDRVGRDVALAYHYSCIFDEGF